MTPEQRRDIQTRLETRITDVKASILQLEHSAAPVSLEQPIGRLSRMDSLANQALSDRRLQESKALLARLEHSLARIADEEFGICVECGEDIAVARLLAVPETVLCVHCAR